MFSKELIDRATIKPPRVRWFAQLVSWWRRITGRDKYTISWDCGCQKSVWLVYKTDTKTGVITIIEIGEGEYNP